MWLFVVFIMLIILVLWIFFIKHNFSQQKTIPKESTELKSLQQEFNQIFSKFKEFKLGEILKKMESNVAPTPSTSSDQPFRSDKDNLNEKEIEELREKLFE
jgi:hypothetical protein